MIKIPVVILAGGIGERIKVLTGGKPKALLHLIGKPLVEYTLENVVKIGAKQVLLVVNTPKDFEDIAVKYGKYLEFELIQQRKPGIEGAAISIRDFIRGDFILLYGDVIAPVDMYKELITVYESGGYGIVIVPEEEVEAYAIVRLDTTGSINSFTEGSTSIGGDGSYVVGGAYVLPREFLEILELQENFIETLNIVNAKYKLKPCIWSGWWVDIEFPWDLLRATLYLLHQMNSSIINSSARISSKAVIEGPVIIDDDVEVDHFAVIKGPTYIGKKSYVGTHTLIRGYTSLEGENVVGSYTEIVWSAVQRGASIGSRSYIGFSIIGENSVIEPGTITLNIIPDGVKVARAIRMEKRGREYTKLGAVIGTKTRVKAYTILKPGEVISFS